MLKKDHILAICYKDDGESIPNPGIIIIIGKIESDINPFKVPHPVKVKIEHAGEG
jgi:hypothetical protein